MKLNEPTLADPLLLTGCALGGPPWGSGGPFSTQDLISTTTFSDDNLLLPSPPNGGIPTPPNSSMSCKGSSPGSTGVELDALLIVGSSDGFAELKTLPPFEYAAAGTTVVVGALALQNDPHLPQMGPAPSSQNNSSSHHSSSSNRGDPHSSPNNNSGLHSSNNHNHPNPHRGGGGGGSTGGSSLVSSPNGTNFSSSVGGSPLFDPVSSSTSIPANFKTEYNEFIDTSDIDDIAALIGTAIADSKRSTLHSLVELDPNGVSSSVDTVSDNWMDFESWIETACQQDHGGGGGGPGGCGPHHQSGRGSNGHPNGPNVLMDQDSTIHTSASDQAFLDGSSSTLQTLLEADSFSSGGPNNPMFHQDIKHSPEFHTTSILQSRLQQPVLGSGQLLRVTSGGNGGGPNTSPSQLPESTTHQQHHPTSIYGLKVDPYTLDPGSPPYMDPLTGEVSQRPHTTHVSPPAVVTSSMMSGGGGGGGGIGSNSNKYRKQYKISNKNNNTPGSFHHPSPDGNTFLSPYGPTSSPFDTSPNGINNGNHHQVSYCPSSSHNDPPRWSYHEPPGHWQSKEQSKLGIKTKRKSSKIPSSSVSLGIDPLDPCGKEKPIHRCNICNRGFLNKSNIKVHLRTHTGEKPFKCDVCGKAFRQKAHLLKHVQIHKRIQRD